MAFISLIEQQIALLRQGIHAATIGILCLSLTFGCFSPAPALASTEGTDVLFGQTAAEHGIPDRCGPDIEATHASVLDENGNVCFGRRATNRAQIASLTKIMTAIVALETLTPEAIIEVTPSAASVGESSAGLMQGDSMTLDASLKALLTASGNDAATAIAEAAGAVILTEQGLEGDGYAYQAAFVSAMNAKSSTLQLANTYFTNPHGLDFDNYAQGQYSCAQDVATMLRYGMSIERLRANIGFTQVDITVNRAGVETVLSLTNTDTMLQTYAGTCAAKTGYTLAAGPCVATAVNRGDGHEYYAVVLGSSSKPQRFTDAAALYDWTYATRETRLILSWQQRIGLWVEYALETSILH